MTRSTGGGRSQNWDVIAVLSASSIHVTELLHIVECADG
jgi:hypothetical protein